MSQTPANHQPPTTGHSRHRIFGIRHHGPGSARSLLRAFEEMQPDCILVEGPPDAHEVLSLLAHEQMQPPVALLVYAPDEPRRAAYYPFALFSPEWQALRFGLSRGIPVRFIDLPQANQMADVWTTSAEEPEPTGGTPQNSIDPEAPTTDYRLPTTGNPDADGDPDESAVPVPQSAMRHDPLGMVAEAAGFGDGERWWEYMVEHRRNGDDIFEGIAEVMSALRSEAPPPASEHESRREVLREAHMRQAIRRAYAEGYERIAVVCGAWHLPALTDLAREKEDAALLKSMPKVKVTATWVPWTYGRLQSASGYGAGVQSPGWYHHLWSVEDAVTTRWLARVARLLRDEDLDASSAHVIEAVRLAESLAALRGYPLPGLAELNEAVRTVMLFGDDLPLRLIHDKLIVGETLGSVPDETPMVPLQIDLAREQRRLRLQPEAATRTLDLDLRKETDLDRSRLLHRLWLLGVPWGRTERVHGKKGTFHEVWQLQWQPEYAVALIEAGAWGNTVLDAATAFVRDKAASAPDLPTLTRLVDRALLADLPDAIEDLMSRLESEAALASDLGHLMDALPPLAEVLRYGNVRGTDARMVSHVVDGMAIRICIGLPGACTSLNDEAAEEMFKRIMAVNGALAILPSADHSAWKARETTEDGGAAPDDGRWTMDDEVGGEDGHSSTRHSSDPQPSVLSPHVSSWQGALGHVAGQYGVHGLVAGRATRLLLDAGVFDAGEAARRLGLALSTANEPAQGAAWLEGFLRGSGLVLLHERTILSLIDAWVADLRDDAFTALLPLLRRTFSTFTPPERRQIGEWARRSPTPSLHRAAGAASAHFNKERAEAALALVAQLLGLER